MHKKKTQEDIWNAVGPASFSDLSAKRPRQETKAGKKRTRMSTSFT